MKTLHELAEKYGCDKLHSHSYINFYSQLLDQIRVRRLLEVGIGFEDLMKPFTPFYVHGASLKMWEEYLPDAEIFACDIRPETLINEGRIHSMFADQGSIIDLLTLTQSYAPWDLVIDDGSHNTEDQIVTAKVLLPYVNHPGAYVIEDVREPDKVLEGIGIGAVIRYNKRPDDCLVIIHV